MDIDRLESVKAAAVTMKANTAIGLILCAAAIAIFTVAPARRQSLVRWLSGLLVMLGIATFAQDLFGVDFRIDQLIVAETSHYATGSPGRMAPSTAVCLALMGLSIFQATREKIVSAQILSSLAGLIGMVSLIGYSYGVPDFYRIGIYTAMAMNTAFVLVTLWCGILLLFWRDGLLAFNRETIGRFLSFYIVPSGLVIVYVLGLLIARFAVIDPTSSAFGISVYTACVMTLLVGSALWAGRRLAAFENQQTLLINELNHRVKNILAVAISMNRQVSRTAPENARASLERISERLHALSNAHALLLETDWSSADLKTIVEMELAPFTQDRGENVSIEGPPIRLMSDNAVNFCMVIHELATNAAKYGSLSVTDGKLNVHWKVDANILDLAWIERGGPPVTPPEENGFGGVLISQSMPNAAIDRRFETEGLAMNLRLPL